MMDLLEIEAIHPENFVNLLIFLSYTYTRKHSKTNLLLSKKRKKSQKGKISPILNSHDLVEQGDSQKSHTFFSILYVDLHTYI